MDLNRAIEYAQLVNAAYAIQPATLVNSAGAVINVGGSAYTVVTTIYACDLATDLNPDRSKDQVSIGLILQRWYRKCRHRDPRYGRDHGVDPGCQVPPGDMPIPCGAGRTDDGFTAMYKSLRTGVAAGSPSVVSALPALPFAQPVGSVTICGHSLGGSLATLLALDLAANSRLKDPTVYTYASPRTGDSSFVSTYDQVVPNTFRVANRIDLVPKLPLPPGYDHVQTLFELNPVQFFPPKVLVKLDIACEHFLDSYLHLLSLASGGAPALIPGCEP